MDIHLHPKQMDFVLAPEHHLAFVGGIGSGKSHAGCVRALMAAGGQIGGERIPTPNLGVITAPSYRMLQDSTLRTFKEIAGQALVDFNKSEMRATIANGSEVLFRSTENFERLRGPSISWYFGDEAALNPSGVRKIMLGRLRQHGRFGYNWLATTPRGRDYIYQTFAVKDRKDYRLIRARTAENVFLAGEFIEALLDEYTGDFAEQELNGEFIAHEGLIYPEFDPLTHVFRGTIDTGRYKNIIAGVDWGYTAPGVILVGGIDGDGRLDILHEEYQRRVRIEEWAAIARNLKATWNITKFVCDPSEPDYAKQFRDAGCDAEAADNRVLPGIQEVRNHLVIRDDHKPRLRLTPGCVNTISEFGQYQWAANRDGLKEEPRKANDHAQDALRYLIMAAADAMSGVDISSEVRKYA